MRSLARVAPVATECSRCRTGDPAGSCWIANSTLPRMPTRMLLKSWATPPASTPRLSSRVARCIAASSSARSASAWRSASFASTSAWTFHIVEMAVAVAPRVVSSGARTRVLDPQPPAVGMPEPRAHARRFTGERAEALAVHLVAIVGVDQLERRRADEVSGIVTEHGADARRDPLDHAVGEQHHHVARMIREEPVAAFAVGEALGVADALGDVLDHGQVEQVVVGVDRSGLQRDGDGRSIGAHEALDDRFGGARLLDDEPIGVGDAHVAVVGVGVRRPVHPAHLAGGPPEDPCVRVVGVDDLPGARPDESDADRGAAEQRPEPLRTVDLVVHGGGIGVCSPGVHPARPH